MALGITMQLPKDDRHNYSLEYLQTNLCVLMSGRVAEELFLGEITTGAGNDIERATTLARKMVCKWGMSENLGPLSFGESDEAIFLGRELVQHRNFSEETSKMIDSEVRNFVEKAHQKAKILLSENSEALHKIAAALLERETLSGSDIDLIMAGETLPEMAETKTNLKKEPKAPPPPPEESVAEDENNS